MPYNIYKKKTKRTFEEKNNYHRNIHYYIIKLLFKENITFKTFFFKI